MIDIQFQKSKFFEQQNEKQNNFKPFDQNFLSGFYVKMKQPKLHCGRHVYVHTANHSLNYIIAYGVDQCDPKWGLYRNCARTEAELLCCESNSYNIPTDGWKVTSQSVCNEIYQKFNSKNPKISLKFNGYYGQTMSVKTSGDALLWKSLLQENSGQKPPACLLNQPGTVIDSTNLYMRVLIGDQCLELPPELLRPVNFLIGFFFQLKCVC